MKVSYVHILVAAVFFAANTLIFPIAPVLAQAPKSVESQTLQQPVNINQASADELQQVKGIGPVLAERIISYRDANGQFKSLEQVKEVKGLGESKFVKIKDQITL